MEGPDPHRLRRLPGVQPGRAAQDQGGGRVLRFAGRRRQGLHGAGRVDGGAARAGLGHRDDLRRMHAVSRGIRRGQALHGAVAALGQTLEDRPRRQPVGAVRHRPGRHAPRAAHALAGRAAGNRLRRPGHRRPVGGRAEGRDDPRAGLPAAAHAGGQTPLPDGGRQAGGFGGRCAPRRRHVRLRDADPQRPQRSPVRRYRCDQDPQRGAQARRIPAGPDLRLLHLQQLLPCLPVPPGQVRRDARQHAQHHP
ncbi:hypothetical protein D9M71_536210 [compost metagenome]